MIVGFKTILINFGKINKNCLEFRDGDFASYPNGVVNFFREENIVF